MTAWLLAVVLTRGADAQLSVHPNERACVQAGERWLREADALAKRLKRPRPWGWACTTTEERPS